MFSKKATKVDKVFNVDLTLHSKCQIVGKDLLNFRGLFRKYDFIQEKSTMLYVTKKYLVGGGIKYLGKKEVGKKCLEVGTNTKDGSYLACNIRYTKKGLE